MLCSSPGMKNKIVTLTQWQPRHCLIVTSRVVAPNDAQWAATSDHLLLHQTCRSLVSGAMVWGPRIGPISRLRAVLFDDRPFSTPAGILLPNWRIPAISNNDISIWSDLLEPQTASDIASRDLPNHNVPWDDLYSIAEFNFVALRNVLNTCLSGKDSLEFDV